MIATDAPSKHQGGIALFWRDSPYWQVEAYQAYDPNVLSFQLVTGQKRWYVVGAYVPPSDTSTIEYVSKALDDQPEGVDPILIGDLNANLADPGSDREHEIAAGEPIRRLATLGRKAGDGDEAGGFVDLC